MPVSHGYRLVENRPFCAEPDMIVAARELIQENELWLFGIFDARIGDGVSKYIEAHLIDEKQNKVWYGQLAQHRFIHR